MKRIKLFILALVMAMTVFSTSAMATLSSANDSAEFPIFTVAAVAIVIMGVLGYFLRSKFK